MEKQKRQLFLGSGDRLRGYRDFTFVCDEGFISGSRESAKLDPWISYWLSLVSFLDSDADDNDQICFDRIESR